MKGLAQVARPDDDAWVSSLLQESPLLPERGQVEAWRRVLPYLPPSLRYELAAVLRETPGASDRGKQASRQLSAGVYLDNVSPPRSDRPLRRLALRAWERWERAAGPWARWSLCLPLLGPEVEDLPSLPAFQLLESASQLAREVVDALRHVGPALVILDLEPVLGVQVAAHLSRAHHARPVLYLARWPYVHAVLPSGSLVAALLAESRRLDSQPAPGVAFVLDAERAAPVGERPPIDPRADNRYGVSAHDLPGVVALRANGISRVLDVRMGGSEPPIELHRYAYSAYERAGVRVSHLRA